MRIRVTRDFGGRITDEKRIHPGEYDLSDPALFGVGKYLLDNGFAEAMEVAVEADPVDAAVDTPDTVSNVSGEMTESDPVMPPAMKPSRRTRK